MDATTVAKFGFSSWLSFVVIIPAAGIFLMYPINGLVLGLDRPYIHSFATAEPILLAGFLLLGVGADIGQHNVFSSHKSIKLAVFQDACVVAAVIALLSYGFIKSAAQSLLFTENMSSQAANHLAGLSTFSVAVLFLSVTFGVYAKHVLMNHEVHAVAEAGD
jgi:hypothetical protein